MSNDEINLLFLKQKLLDFICIELFQSGRFHPLITPLSRPPCLRGASKKLKSYTEDVINQFTKLTNGKSCIKCL